MFIPHTHTQNHNSKKKRVKIIPLWSKHSCKHSLPIKVQQVYSNKTLYFSHHSKSFVFNLFCNSELTGKWSTESQGDQNGWQHSEQRRASAGEYGGRWGQDGGSERCLPVRWWWTILLWLQMTTTRGCCCWTGQEALVMASCMLEHHDCWWLAVVLERWWNHCFTIES